ncbi:MAG: bifunctional 5,10-methylenetetrahydrofolate dehydrogenase/5,10-methenyltetrahydrofolate cyclohydrolase [Parachlamydiales bacterium]|nr:bifunctional 5,10-methylenetetrahydrofolate dehydrogenase/5,10-methenyltetrahydrofolate cyclohydrolase [Parachlamydiales bacterium]
MIIEGKKIAAQLNASLKKKIDLIQGRKPGLAFILVGNNPSSITYVNMKKKASQKLGIYSQIIHLPENTSHQHLIEEIDKLNLDPLIDAILIQLPLPSHLPVIPTISLLDPTKDVDGFHPYNFGKMLLGDLSGLLPCTPLGIKVLFEKSAIEVEGKHVVILGRSNIVGKPLAAMLMQKHKGCNATVTIAHSHTQNLTDLTRRADILVAAIGMPLFVTKSMVKKGAVVIDVGINKIHGTMVGDVHYAQVAPIASAITPVPGGVGPMTVAMLMRNTYHCFMQRNKR